MNMLQNLSIAQLAGQRLMAGFEGTVFNRDLEFLIDRLKVGGLILFAQNIDTPEQVYQLCNSIQDFAFSCGQPPLFIAIDQEGGTVARLRKPHFKEFPAMPDLKDQSEVEAFSRDMANEVSKLGLNMNMAPVMDVAPPGFDSVMEKRIFGHDPHRVAKMGRIVIEHHQKQGIMAVAKHFPGIGRTTLDSHLDLPELDITKTELTSFDLIPFAAAIDTQISGIMLSHIRYSGLDPKWPASLSPVITKNLLRLQMGYDGIVMTDDLDMGAIVNYYDIHTVIRQILTAEVDLALICHKSEKIEIAFEEIQKRISDDKKFYAKNKNSIHRILTQKNRFLLNHY